VTKIKLTSLSSGTRGEYLYLEKIDQVLNKNYCAVLIDRITLAAKMVRSSLR
jgi:hypothetical protein